MANKKFLIFLVALSSVAVSLSLPASDKDSENDVHLNSVLPEKEQPSLPLKTADPEAAAAEQPQVELERLELLPEVEATTKGPVETFPTTTNPTYFSRVITSIFEIPIAVLTAVRNLLQTTATAAPKIPAVVPQ